MMKCVFVVVLLQVCYSRPPPNSTPTSFTPNFNLNTEILTGLQQLSKSVRHTMFIPVPGKYMANNTSKCVYKFSRKLINFLGNMTQEGPVKDIIERLVLNLTILAQHPQRNSNCTMPREKQHNNPFQEHIDFIRKLNNGR